MCVWVCVYALGVDASHVPISLLVFHFFHSFVALYSHSHAGLLACALPALYHSSSSVFYSIHQGIQTNMLQFVWHDTLNDFDGKSIFLCYSARAFNLNLCGFKRLSDRRRYWPMTMDVCASACMSNRGRKKSITFQLSAWGLTVKSN